MKTWIEGKLGDYYEFSSGLSKSAKEFGFGEPFLSFKTVFNNYYIPDEINDLANTTEKEQEKCSIKEGDVFLTRTSETIDELGMSTVALKDYPKATFNGFTKRLRPKYKDCIYPRYAAYYFRSDYFRKHVTSFSTMTTRASLNNDMLGRLPIIVPPYEIQKKIGDMLYLLDQKIEINSKLNANLEEINKNLYNEWFVNYRIPNKFELGECIIVDGVAIPSNWSVISLGDICDISSGKRPPVKTKERTCENKIPIIGANGVMAYTNAVNIDYPILIIGRVGTLGSIQRYNQELWASDNTLLITTKYINFIQQYLSTVDYTGLNRGSTQPLITQGDMKKCRVIMPDNEVLEEFEQIAQQNNEAIATNSRQNENLSILRNSLLQKLMSGDIDLSEVELMV